MLARIPGINLARGGGDSRRGLGAGGNKVLINGRRVAGKGNEGNAQLSRIPATEVEYIEIIRGVIPPLVTEFFSRGLRRHH